MTSSTRTEFRVNLPIPSSAVRRRTGTVLIALSGTILVASAVTKFLGLDAVVSQLEGFGFAGEIVPLGLLEVATATLFLFPRTRFAGLLMFSAFLGGAVATHIQHGILPVPPAFVLALGWAGIWLRYAVAMGDPAGAIRAFERSQRTTFIQRSTRLQRVSVRVSQIVLGAAAVLFLMIGAKYVFDPQTAAGASGLALLSSFGMTNMRAGVGGFSLGFGAIAGLSVPFARRTTAGLWFLAIVVGTVLFVRLMGAANDGSLLESRTLLIAEAVLTSLSVGALLLDRAGRRQAQRT
jgi:hypothetical protein